jgi:hypothetical protein
LQATTFTLRRNKTVLVSILFQTSTTQLWANLTSRNCLKSGGACGYAGDDTASLSMEVSESESLPLTPSGAIFNRTPSPSPARSNVFDALQPVMLHESKISFDHSQHIQFPFSKLSVVQHLREEIANVKKLTTSTSCHDHPSI